MSKAKSESDIAVEEMFRKEGIYKPLHIKTKRKPAGQYEKRKRSKAENDEQLCLDKSKPGGRFIIDGQPVNANGDFIDDAGNVIACRLLERKPFKMIFPIGYLVTVPQQNSKGHFEPRMKRIYPKPSTVKIINEKANEIIQDIEAENFSIEEKEFEFNLRKDRMIQKILKSQTSGGRKEGFRKMPPEEFRIEAVEKACEWFEKFDDFPSDVELPDEMRISKATFYRRLRECKWSLETIRAKARKKMKKIIIESY